MTKEIKLSRGMIAVVDDDDWERANKLRWYSAPSGNTFYAARRPDSGIVYLHRFIMAAPDGTQVDHIDRDGLNCKRSNLRICSHGENQHHYPIPRNSTSGYKGVSFSKWSGRWRARIKVQGKSKYLGQFDTKEDAALAYNVAAVEFHGAFALLNNVVVAGNGL